MGMIDQCLPPGVQYPDSTCLGTNLFWVGGTLQQSPSRSLKKQTVCFGLVDIKQSVKAIGYGEHDMKMPYRWQIGRKFIDPLRLLCKLALWAMPVAARVIGLFGVPTLVALISVAAQSRCPAIFYGMKSLQLIGAQIVCPQKTVPTGLENIGQFNRLFLVFHHTCF
jgi:hypothetical protein